jgi:hypothetical protein
MQTKRQCNRIFNYIKKKGKTIYQPGILYQPEIPFKKEKIILFHTHKSLENLLPENLHNKKGRSSDTGNLYQIEICIYTKKGSMPHTQIWLNKCIYFSLLNLSDR